MKRDSIDVIIVKQDDVFLNILAEKDIELALRDYFTIVIPTYRRKKKGWNGKVPLFNTHTKTLYVGLLPYVIDFLKKRGKTYKILNFPKKPKISPQEVADFIESLDLPDTFDKRDYQMVGFYHALNDQRVILESATGSGKSLMIYYIVRWLMNKGLSGMLVVPTTALVNQMYTDFEEYAEGTDWSVYEHCHRLYSGFEKHTDKQLLITTWQSVYDMPEEYFEGRRFIIGDEAHEFTAKSLKTLMEKMVDCPIRIGTTGTLQNEECHYLVLEGLFGKARFIAKTKPLMDRGYLSELMIYGVLLKYNQSISNAMYGSNYNDEIDFLINYSKRNNYIKNLAYSLKGNTLILVRYPNLHGKMLYEAIKEDAGERHVYFLHGKVDVDEREEVRKILEVENDSILIASMGVFSRGSNVKNLHNLILASPLKSRTRNRQSIGRILRKSFSKELATLYDLGDDMRAFSTENYSLRHFKERIKIYTDENFNYRIIKGVKL